MKSFSDFIRNASEEEKREVYNRVMDEATKKQRKVMGLPSGKAVLSAYKNQCSDDSIPLEKMIDNAIGMTMRICWGLDRNE